MNYYRAFDLQKETDLLYEQGIDCGNFVGFNCLKELYNVKRGCTTYITGIPSHGKTVFHFEILMNLSEFYGWKHAIFTPETGNNAEIITELAHTYIRKPFNKKFENRMSQNEKYKADTFLQEFFYLLNPEESKMTVSELLNICLEIKKEHQVDTFSIDPFNELKHDLEAHGKREDKYLEYTLGKIRRFARDNNIHVFIIAHPRTLRTIDGTYNPPSAYDLSGGAAWYSKAESIICVHRPNVETNETQIIIQKAKPKHIGKKGQASLFFDWFKNRYYERSLSGMDIYAHKEEKVSVMQDLVPNISFYEKDEIPF